MNQRRKLDPAVQSLLHGLAANTQPELDVPGEARAQKIEALRDAYRRIHGTDPGKFRPGDLVRWQPGLKYVKWPQYGESVVVVESLDPPGVENVSASYSPYFRSPQSLVLGLQCKDGFHCWHFDGRRFELVS
jgi:hypothetical protein